MMVLNVAYESFGLNLGEAAFAYVLFFHKLSTKHNLHLLGGTYVYFP